jgi:hypothetical protein
VRNGWLYKGAKAVIADLNNEEFFFAWHAGGASGFCRKA